MRASSLSSFSRSSKLYLRVSCRDAYGSHHGRSVGGMIGNGATRSAEVKILQSTMPVPLSTSRVCVQASSQSSCRARKRAQLEQKSLHPRRAEDVANTSYRHSARHSKQTPDRTSTSTDYLVVARNLLGERVDRRHTIGVVLDVDAASPSSSVNDQKAS